MFDFTVICSDGSPDEGRVGEASHPESLSENSHFMVGAEVTRLQMLGNGPIWQLEK